jgi:CPA1 family monovalent cation:H+ antiporter
VIGAVLSPTDPVSVVAIFRSLEVPARLRLIVEGESLFNDGTGATLFTILKGALVGAAGGLAGGGGPSAWSAGAEFCRIAGLGAVVGLASGGAAFWMLRRLNDHTLETGITVALAWGSYLLADAMGASGVVASVVAGLVTGNYGRPIAMQEATRTTLTGFWDSLDFLVNSVLFLLVGLELSDPEVGGLGHLLQGRVLLAAALVYASLLAARAVMAFAVCAIAREWPRRWNGVLWWSGLRGGLSLALTMALPPGEFRRFALSVVFLVVLATLLVQATTMPAVLRRAGVAGS